MRISVLPARSHELSHLERTLYDCEEIGINCCYFYDHLYEKVNRVGLLDVLVVCSYSLSITKRLGIGTLVLRIGSHDNLGCELTSLERLFGRRFYCGLGIGDSDSLKEDQSYGLKRPDQPSRLSMLEKVLSNTSILRENILLGGKSRSIIAICESLRIVNNRWMPSSLAELTVPNINYSVVLTEYQVKSWMSANEVSDVTKFKFLLRAKGVVELVFAFPENLEFISQFLHD